MSMNAKTKERLASLTPEFAKIITELLELGYQNNLSPQVSCGYRSPEEQAGLYDKGRTKPGAKVTNARPWQSLHQYKIAADLFFLVDGKADFSEKNYRLLWDLACKAGLDKRGLVWSGKWVGSLRESAHFQLGNPKWQDLYDKHVKSTNS